MPFSPRVKQLAYADDPACWISYSGKPPSVKRRMDARRLAALLAAQRFVDAYDKVMARKPAFLTPKLKLSFPHINADEAPMSSAMPTLKIQMLLHFSYVPAPFTPETKRTAPAYTVFVQQLLDDGMIERPTDAEREDYPGWAYKTTAKGDCYVDALKAVPLPVPASPQWVMPTK